MTTKADRSSAQSAFWSYRSDAATPDLSVAVAAGAIRADTTPAQWEQMTPGMRREILRTARKASA